MLLGSMVLLLPLSMKMPDRIDLLSMDDYMNGREDPKTTSIQHPYNRFEQQKGLGKEGAIVLAETLQSNNNNNNNKLGSNNILAMKVVSALAERQSCCIKQHS